MIDDSKILTLHPQGKKGTNISRAKYDLIKEYILKRLGECQDMAFQDLFDGAIEELSADFDGKVGWYVVTVKLDLEARKIIERVPRTSPHSLRMI